MFCCIVLLKIDEFCMETKYTKKYNQSLFISYMECLSFTYFIFYFVLTVLMSIYYMLDFNKKILLASVRLQETLFSISYL